MARAKAKWGFRLDQDAPPETRPEILEAIRERADFEIPDAGMKELARIIGFFHANRAHEPLKNYPSPPDQIEALNRLAYVWSGAKIKETIGEIDDVTRRHLIDVADLIKAAELGLPVDSSILAAHSGRRAIELQKELGELKKQAKGEERKGVRQKPHDYTLRALIMDLADFFTRHTGTKATANFQHSSVSKSSGAKAAQNGQKPAPLRGRISSPFVRFAYLVLITIEPEHPIRFKRHAFGQVVRDVVTRGPKRLEKLLSAQV